MQTNFQAIKKNTTSQTQETAQKFIKENDKKLIEHAVYISERSGIQNLKKHLQYKKSIFC